MDFEQDQSRARYAPAPSGLSRFLFYARPTGDQLGAFADYKRSASALDALSGVTLGKRALPSSGQSMELLKMEPFLGRQIGLRAMPGLFDLRWAPFNLADAAEQL